MAVNRIFKKIIPTPQHVICSDGCKSFSLSTPLKVCIRGDVDIKLEYAAEFFKQYALTDFGLQVDIVSNKNDCDVILTNRLDMIPGCFSDEELDLLAKGKYSAKQGYAIRISSHGFIVVYGAKSVGCLYGVTTLLQIMSRNKSVIEFPLCRIIDYPEFLVRGNTWLIGAELLYWSYDFGDGIEKYRKRFIEKLDMSVRHKINLILHDGFGWSSEKFDGYKELVLELNREARLRGIHLMTAGYGSSYGMSGWGDGGLYKGEVPRNRTSYPDGEIYSCQGYTSLITTEGSTTYGTCVSNEELYKIKEDELKRFVHDVEPGAMYIHNLDNSEISELNWINRCPSCRDKWPSDSLTDLDGAAGAYAYYYDHLADAINSVEKDGYDPNEDLLLFMISPGYSVFNNNLKSWETALKYFTTLGTQIENSNIVITFREQFFGYDDNFSSTVGYGLRFEELERSISQNCPELLTGMIYFPGGDGYYSDRLMVTSPVFNYTQKGVDMILTANGSAYQEPLQLLNAEYLWNCDNSDFFNVTDKPDNYFSFIEIYNRSVLASYRPEEIYGPEGFISVACKRLYGCNSDVMYKFFTLHGKHGQSPIAFLSNVDIKFGFFQLPHQMSWNIELSNTKIDVFIDQLTIYHALTVEAEMIMDGCILGENEVVDWMHENIGFNVKVLSLILDYMVIYKSMVRYFSDNETCRLNNGTREKISALIERTKKLIVDNEQSGIHPIDYAGASFSGRRSALSFLADNLELMLDSMKSNKRMPKVAYKPLQWW